MKPRAARFVPRYLLDVTVDLEALRDAAGRIETHVKDLTAETCRRALPPVLRGMLLRADNTGLTLHATNWATAGRVTIPGEVRQAGEVLVSARHFCPYTRAFPGGRARLHAEGQSMEMSFFPGTGEALARLRVTLLQMPVEDYARAEGLAEPVDPRVKPARPSGRENALARHGKRAASPALWKAPRASDLFTPEPFGVGDWVMMPDGQGGTRAGQVWMAAALGRGGWVIVPGEDRNRAVEIRAGRHGRYETASGVPVQRCASGVERELEALPSLD